MRDAGVERLGWRTLWLVLAGVVVYLLSALVFAWRAGIWIGLVMVNVGIVMQLVRLLVRSRRP